MASKMAAVIIALTVVTYSLLIHLQLAAGGTTYVRWGRTICSDYARLLYKGYIAGSAWNDTGSGANFLCVPEVPQWGVGNLTGRQNFSASLYGVQYNLVNGYKDDAPFTYKNIEAEDLNFMDAVCAVCYAPTAETTVMVPGRHFDCNFDNSTDWRLEYRGYLMAQMNKQWRSEYICVDVAPEARSGSEANKLGGALSPVQVGCGVLPCDTYVNGFEVACSVCSI